MLTDNIRKPKCVAVICEYNPLHNGHAYHISRIRNGIGDQGCILGIMSGNFTQRGEPAIIPKYERALAAVKSGMDIVVELPFPFSLHMPKHLPMAAFTLPNDLEQILSVSEASAAILRRSNILPTYPYPTNSYQLMKAIVSFAARLLFMKRLRLLQE